MNNLKSVSIVMPVYNEERTIRSILDSIRQVNFGGRVIELIIVNDGSSDGTKQILDQMQDQHTVAVHKKNGGKGSAIQAGLEHATKDVVVIQDADVEYDPNDLPKLVEKMEQDKLRVVYGSRFLGTIEHMPLPNWVANKLLTGMVNFFWAKRLTDSCTCYKMLDRELMQSFNLKDRGFDICHEITSNLYRRKIPIVEVPIRYSARSGSEGKKAKWWNLLKSMWAVTYYRFTPLSLQQKWRTEHSI